MVLSVQWRRYKGAALLFLCVLATLGLVRLCGPSMSSRQRVALVADESYLRLYEQLHSEASPERALILRLPDAGVGNRLTASVSALVLGMLMRRPVFIDGGAYRFAKLFSPLRLAWDFDAALIGPAAVEWTDDDVASLLCRSDLAAVSTGPVALTTGQYFLPHLQANPAYAHIFARGGPLASADLFGDLLKRYFAPVPHLQLRIDAVLAGARSRRVIGVHLRDLYHTIPNKKRQLECAAYLAPQSTEESVFYVSSDTAEWRRGAVAWFGGAEKVLSNGATRDEDLEEDPQYSGHTEALESAVVDLWVLGNCADLVLSAGSTFSYTAQSLQGHPGVIVTRDGKCVRSLSHAPQSGRFPDLAKQPCWKDQMWDVGHDMLCSDLQNPIACGGKSERANGESTEWVTAMVQQQIAELNATMREEREAMLEARKESRSHAAAERPDFWK